MKDILGTSHNPDSGPWEGAEISTVRGLSRAVEIFACSWTLVQR